MRQVTIAAIQMACERVDDKAFNPNIKKALELSRKAAQAGAQIILLPELFDNWYFCQERNYDSYKLAKSLEESPTVAAFRELCAELELVMPISFYEKAGNTTFNTIAMIDADGSILGTYRKTHIPDDHYYQEKFYFTSGDTGFKAFKTRYGTIGCGICWDQWFPESARSMALAGAEILMYPTAIGSEPILETDSMPHWRRVMQGHSAANLMPLIAANRIGTEAVSPSQANGGQNSQLKFYGSSFMTDAKGDIIENADRESEQILLHSYDLDSIADDRLSWGLFRDRRPEAYSIISSHGEIQ